MASAVERGDGRSGRQGPQANLPVAHAGREQVRVWRDRQSPDAGLTGRDRQALAAAREAEEVPPLEGAQLALAVLRTLGFEQIPGLCDVSGIPGLERHAHVGCVQTLPERDGVALGTTPLRARHDDANDDGGRERCREAGDNRLLPAPAPDALGRGHWPGRYRFSREPSGEVVSEGFGRPVAIRCALGETLEADRFEIPVDGGVHRVGRGRVVLDDLPHGFEWRGTSKWQPVREQLIKHHAQAEHVSSGRQSAGLASRLLGRHVVRRTQHGERLRHGAPTRQLLRDTEVGDLRFTVRVDENVARLEIAVQDAVLMRKVHRTGDAHHEASGTPLSFEGFGTVDWRGRRGILAQPLLQTATFDQPRAEIVLAAGLAHFVDWNDVRVIELGGRFRLGTEALDHRGRRQRPSRDHLERDDTIQPDLSRAVDHPHAPARDFLDDFVAADRTLRRRRVLHEAVRRLPERDRRGTTVANCHERSRAGVRVKQLLHFAKQLGIAAGGLLEDPGARSLIAVECCDEKLGRPAPSIGVHRSLRYAVIDSWAVVSAWSVEMSAGVPVRRRDPRMAAIDDSPNGRTEAQLPAVP